MTKVRGCPSFSADSLLQFRSVSTSLGFLQRILNIIKHPRPKCLDVVLPLLIPQFLTHPKLETHSMFAVLAHAIAVHYLQQPRSIHALHENIKFKQYHPIFLGRLGNDVIARDRLRLHFLVDNELPVGLQLSESYVLLSGEALRKSDRLNSRKYVGLSKTWTNSNQQLIILDMPNWSASNIVA